MKEVEMDKISKLLEETQNLLECFSSGSLSPVSNYYDSDFEPNEDEFGVVDEFKKLLRKGDNSKICKFIESWEEQQQQLPKGAIHIAIEENCKDLEVFKSLLRVGCDPLEFDSNEKTALTILLERNDEERERGRGINSMFEDDDDCTISTLLGEWELRRAATRDSKIFQFIHSRNWKELYFLLLSSTDPIQLICKADAKYAGISPLHEISALNHVSTLRKLLKKFKGIDFNVKAIGSGNTPLHEATHMTSAEMVSFLLENGAKCDVKNAAGKIPAHLGTEKIQVIIEIKNMKSSQEEIKQPPSTNLLSSKKSADLFFKATKSTSSDSLSLSREERKLKQIIGFLDQIEKHESKYVTNEDIDEIEDSEIGSDVSESEIDMLEDDIKAAGGRGNGTENKGSGNTVSSNPSSNTAKFNASGDTVKFNASGSTVKLNASGNTAKNNNHLDRSLPRADNIENILQRENHSGRTILHRFARRNQSEKIIKFLKEHDFDGSKCKLMKLFEVIDNSGCTPLHDAASEGSLEAAKIFLFGGKAAKSKNLLINPSIPAAITGDTPLHAAASSGNVEIVELLLAVGASKEAENIEGKRAVDVTRSKGVKKLLIDPNPIKEEERKRPIRATEVHNKILEVTQETKEVNGVSNNKSDETIKVNTSNNSTATANEMPVKRGPGRPRKYPRPDEPIYFKVAKATEEKNVDKFLFLSSLPAQQQPQQPQLKTFSFTEIERESCLILVKFKNDWLMLFEQFQQIISHLSTNKNNNIPPATTTDLIEASLNDKITITRLPKIGKLILSLQSFDNLNFIPKWRAIQIIEKEFRVHLNGPFGYIDIPRISRLRLDKGNLCTVVSTNAQIKNVSLVNLITGCPLKLKLKLEKRQIISSNWWLNTQFCEEQKSPKSFHM